MTTNHRPTANALPSASVSARVRPNPHAEFRKATPIEQAICAIDIALMRSRIKVSAFTQGVTVADPAARPAGRVSRTPQGEHGRFACLRACHWRGHGCASTGIRRALARAAR